MFLVLAALALLFSLVVLFALIIDAFLDGLPRLNPKFLTSFPSRKPEEAGILPAMVGSIGVTVLTILFAIPLGVGSAVYLEVYAPKNRLNAAIEASITTLGGVPSIIYGMLGLELFARVCSSDEVSSPEPSPLLFSSFPSSSYPPGRACELFLNRFGRPL